MNCETIDAILDEHRTARLDQPERQAVVAHLDGCARCSEGWAAHDALLGEYMGEPSLELVARALVHVSECRAQARAGSRRSVALAAAAAIAAVAVIAATFSLSGPDTSRGHAVVADVAATATAEPVFVAGRDYELLSLPAAAPEAVDRIPVIEFFMYPCFHCYTFEPELALWDAREQRHVALTRVPAVFTREAELHARAFYTAEVLGKLDAIHAAFYEEIHTRGNGLASSGALAEFFQRFGIEAATFTEVFNSREVDARVQRAVALSREYGIRATPSLVVGGRYSTNPGLAGARMLAVVDYLVAEEAVQGAAADCSARARCDARPRSEPIF
jgi:thiol:disulfide interchange protein DsbA